MAIIIGSLTNVTVGGVTDGFQSVQWAVQVQNNRLWSLGNWNAYRTQVTKTLTASVTTYAGVLSSINITPSTSCVDSQATKSVTVDINICPGQQAVDDFNGGSMYVTSYSYSKGDPNSFGSESWSFQRWVDADATGANIINTLAPSLVLLGISEGNFSGTLSEANMGIQMQSTQRVTGSQGSVSAGFPGQGNADEITYGLVTRIGGGILESAGNIGNSSVSIPHQPLYF